MLTLSTHSRISASKMKNKLKIRKNDIIILCIILIAAAAILLLRGNTASLTAQIIVDGEILYDIPLREVEENYTLCLKNGVSIEISQDYVRFASSDCSSKSCVACGRLTSAEEAAVCIPNKTLLRLSGKTVSSPDIITY